MPIYVTNEMFEKDHPYDKDSAIDWLLQTLIKSNGQRNLFPLHGEKNTPKSDDIIFAQNTLSTQGHIRKVHGAIGATFAITPEGKRYFYKRVYDKVINRLLKEDDFIKVSSILAELKIEDKDDELADAIESKLEAEGKVFATDNDGIMLKPDAKNSLLHSKFGFEEEKSTVANTNINVGGNFDGILNTGKMEESQNFLDKSFKPEASKSTPTTKSKITVESILKITAAIITLALAVLKGCNII